VALEDIESLLDGLKSGAPEAATALGDVNDILKSLSASSELTTGVLGRLSSAVRDEAAANAAAAALGVSAGQVRAALAAEAKAAADLQKQAAEQLKLAAKAEEEAAQKATRAAKEAAEAREKASAPMRAFGDSMLQSAQSATQLSGPLGQVQNALSKLGPVGQGAAMALGIWVMVITAVVSKLREMMETAIEVNQHLDLMRARFAALAGSASAGRAVTAMVDKLSASLPFAKAQVEGWAQALLAAGIKGKQLEADIKAIAAATALMGESGGAAAEQMFKRLGEGGPAADKLLKEIQTGGRRADKMLKEMGLSVADLGGQAAVAKMNAEQLHAALAKAMAKKGAGPLADLALTFPVILQKAKEGLFSLFDKLGPSVKVFMTAVKSLFAEFNKGGSVINGLKPTVTAVFVTLFAWATKAVNVVHEFVKAVMGTGKPGILTTVVNFLKTIMSNAHVLQGLKVVLYVIVGVLGVLGAVFVVVTALWGAFVASIVDAFGTLTSVFDGVGDEASSAGQSIIDGLLGFDVGAFVDKMAGMAKAGLAAFKSVLGIASPSKVLMEHGEEDIAGGAAMGVDKGNAKVKASAKRMGEAAVPDGGRGGRGRGGDVHYHYSGPVEHYPTFREHMKQFLQEMAGESGAQPEGAT